MLNIFIDYRLNLFCTFSVRYGDRTPSSAWARVFAVFWIFFGITFFAMYLGTITSVMTKNLYEKPEFEVAGKRVIELFIYKDFFLIFFFFFFVFFFFRKLFHILLFTCVENVKFNVATWKSKNSHYFSSILLNP